MCQVVDSALRDEKAGCQQGKCLGITVRSGPIYAIAELSLPCICFAHLCVMCVCFFHSGRLAPSVTAKCNYCSSVFLWCCSQTVMEQFYISMMEFLQVKNVLLGFGCIFLPNDANSCLGFNSTAAPAGKIPVGAFRYLNVRENVPQESFLANSLEKFLTFLSAVDLNKQVLIIVAWKTILEFELWMITLYKNGAATRTLQLVSFPVWPG